MAAATVVCCSMTSESQTWYGSGVWPGAARHGNTRRCRSYQVSSAEAAGAMGAGDTKGDIAAGARHVYGPRPVGALVPRVTRPAFRRHSAASARIMADWAAIVGPALAAVTTPRRLSAGTLTVACSGPVAVELQHLAAQLIERINTHLGDTPVQRLRFLQATQSTIPVPPRVKISVTVQKAAQRAVADLPEGPLRDALAALGSAVIASRGKVV
jgi:hypothetical protein